MKAVDRHLGLVVTFLTTAVFVAKTLVAARLELTTALAIVGATPTTPLLLGLAVAVVPAIAASATGYLIAEVGGRWVRRRPLLFPLLGLGAALVGVAAFLPWLLLVFTAFWAVLEYLRARSDRPLVDSGETTPAAAVLVRGRVPIYVATLVFVPLMVLSPDPWPAEVLITDDGTTTGFVLQSDDTWWTVLSHSDRSVIYIPSGDVTGRFLCDPDSPPGPLLATIPQLFLDQPDLPRCADPR